LKYNIFNIHSPTWAA